MRKTSYVVPISVKGIVFERDGVWLRKNERDEWELPGGKLDKGEQPEEAVLRELKEELGINVQVVDIVQAYLYSTEVIAGNIWDALVVTYLCKLIEKVGDFEIKGEAGTAVFKKFPINKIEVIKIPPFYKETINIAYKLEKFLAEKNNTPV